MVDLSIVFWDSLPGRVHRQGPVGAAKVMIYAMLTGRISDAIHLDLQQAGGERSNAEQGQGTAGCSPNRLAILF